MDRKSPTFQSRIAIWSARRWAMIIKDKTFIFVCRGSARKQAGSTVINVPGHSGRNLCVPQRDESVRDVQTIYVNPATSSIGAVARARKMLAKPLQTRTRYRKTSTSRQSRIRTTASFARITNIRPRQPGRKLFP